MKFHEKSFRTAASLLITQKVFAGCRTGTKRRVILTSSSARARWYLLDHRLDGHASRNEGDEATVVPPE
jgi:hypothetical protein